MAYHRPADLARSAAKLIANRKGMRSDAFRRETFALPRAAAREKARELLRRFPKAAYQTEIASEASGRGPVSKCSLLWRGPPPGLPRKRRRRR